MASSAVADVVAHALPFAPEPPRPLRRELAPAESFPVEALGPVLGMGAAAIQDRIQAPMALCAQAVLAAATLATQGHADVRLPYGQTRPLSEYFVSIAESGERKTSADSEALRPIRRFEALLRDAYESSEPSFRNELEAWEAERKRILSSRSECSLPERKAALDGLGPAPRGPVEAMLTCPEPTFEGLARLYETSRPGLGLFSAEGGQFIGGYGMSPDHRLKTSAALSALWDGAALRRVRAGDGSITLPGRRLAFHLMVQPAVAVQLLGDSQLEEQGLLSRLLVVAPETTAGSRLWREPSAETERNLQIYEDRLYAVLSEPLPLRENSLNELQPRALDLSPEARALWIEFHNHIERQLAEDGQLQPIRAFGSKIAEHAARLGAILLLVDDSTAASLDESHLAAGVKLAQFYASEWLRLHHSAETPPELERAERLRRWLHVGWTEPVIGLPEVYQLGPNCLRHQKAALEAVELLAQHGWLVQIDGGTEVRGVRRKQAWRIVREGI